MTNHKTDNDDKAWSFYKSYYGKNLNVGNKFFKHGKACIEVSGDVCFNIMLRKEKRYTFLGSILKNEDKTNFDKLNELFEKLVASPVNISIMPKPGGLNNIKKWIGNDRFDVYIWIMNMYYAGNSTPILNGGAVNMSVINRRILKEFLDSFSSIYDYCEYIYGMDESLVNKVLLSGEKTILDAKGCYEYISLARDFWETRVCVIEKKCKRLKFTKEKKILDKISAIIKI